MLIALDRVFTVEHHVRDGMLAHTTFQMLGWVTLAEVTEDFGMSDSFAWKEPYPRCAQRK